MGAISGISSTLAMTELLLSAAYCDSIIQVGTPTPMREKA